MDRRVILGIALQQLEKQLKAANIKADKASSRSRGIDCSNSTKRAIAVARNNTMFSRRAVDEIERRIDLVKNELC